MKTPVRTRLLSALLSLVMLVSLLPVSVFAAEPEAGTWTKVELADITADDTVAITMTKGDSTWVLPNNGDAKAAAKAITGTVSGNTLTTSEKDLFGWKVVKGADSFQLVSAATGKYLYSTSSNNGIRQGTGENRDWVVDTESGYLKNVALSRYVGVYNNQDWRSYTSVHANIAGQTLGFWKLSTVPARESGIVTDLTTLQNGDKVVVFNPANKKALSSVYNGFYNTGVDVELTGGKLTGYTNAELWTVNRTESGAYTFSTADGKKLSMDEKYSSTPPGQGQCGLGAQRCRHGGLLLHQERGPRQLSGVVCREEQLELLRNHRQQRGSVCPAALSGGRHPGAWPARPAGGSLRSSEERRPGGHLQPRQPEGPVQRVQRLL